MEKHYKILGLIFSFLFLISFASAFCDWSTYGNSFTPLWNEQLSPTTCYGRFDAGINNISITNGMTAGDQPLISDLNSTDATSKIVFINGNYLQIYDKDLNLESEKLIIGTPQGQPDILDFNNDGKKNEIALISEINATHHQLQIITYITATRALNKTFDYDFNTTVNPTFSGLKHSGEKVLVLFNQNTSYSNFSQINETGNVKSIYLPYVYTSNPVSYWDMDNDGLIEYMAWNSSKITVFNENGIIKYQRNSSSTETISKAIIYPICFKQWYELFSVCNVEWSIAYMSNRRPVNDIVELYADRLSGANIWTDTLMSTGSSGTLGRGIFAVQDDANGDGYADLFSVVLKQDTLNAGNEVYRFSVISGRDGSFINDTSFTAPSPRPVATFNNGLTIADMNHNGKYDFIYTNSPYFWIYDPYSGDLYKNVSINGFSTCVPSDLNFDGFQEITCSYSGKTNMFYSNTTNQNAVLVSVTYSPSTSLALGQTLNIFITATDLEGDIIQTIKRCDNNESFISSSVNPTCSFSSVGVYNVTVGIKDPFHTNYSFLSQNIIVSSTGTVCGNSVCESGESNLNCALDCPLETTSVSSSAGGLTVPVSIVDTANTNQGWLPEIYYGILGFLSNTLQPMMVIIFVIFFVLIIITIGAIIGKLFRKVGGG